MFAFLFEASSLPLSFRSPPFHYSPCLNREKERARVSGLGPFRSAYPDRNVQTISYESCSLLRSCHSYSSHFR